MTAAPTSTRAARLRRWASTAAAVAVIAGLAGCSGPPTPDDELFDAARQANLLFKQSVATVQLHVYDGDWQVQDYGDEPLACDGGYSFSMHRTTPEGWTLDDDAPTPARRLTAWLGDRGWTTRDAVTDPDGQVVVEASDPAFGIVRLIIEIRDGEASADAIGICATSASFDGDPDELTAILYPGWPDDPAPHDAVPAAEPAGAVPVFGYTEDGHPR
jgi:hypothetical protein